MVTQLLPPREADTTADGGPPKTPSSRRREIRLGVLWGLLGSAVFAFVVVVAHNARRGAVAARHQEPERARAHRGPVRPLFGWTHWITFLQISTVIAMVLIVVTFVVLWRLKPYHPILLMAIVCTTLVWQDPIMNWAPYAAYNPQLWHWPETWPLVSLSPTVEPFIVVGYVMFYLAPFFPAIWVLRRLQRNRAVDSFVWRHPLVSWPS